MVVRCDDFAGREGFLPTGKFPDDAFQLDLFSFQFPTDGEVFTFSVRMDAFAQDRSCLCIPFGRVDVIAAVQVACPALVDDLEVGGLHSPLSWRT